MYEKFADKGKNKVEIYSWVARDIMAKASGLEKLDSKQASFKEKTLYKDFMTGKVDVLEYDGKKFTAPPLPSLIPCCTKKKKKQDNYKKSQ